MILLILLLFIIIMGTIEEIAYKNQGGIGMEDRGILFGGFTMLRGLCIMIKGIYVVIKNIVTRKGER